MDHFVIEHDDIAEKEAEVCFCNGGPSLDILKDVHKAYEKKLEVVNKVGGRKKSQMQIDVLRCWVRDLTDQNTLLVRAVEEMEAEIIKTLRFESNKRSEVACELQAEGAVLRRRLARKDSDIRGLIEVLRRLREFDYCTLDGIHFFEVTESDIFGSVEWRQRKLDHGDVIRNNLKPVAGKTKRNRQNRFL